MHLSCCCCCCCCCRRCRPATAAAAADNDVRLARRIQRDVEHRGRNIGNVIEQYTRFVKPSFDTFVAPSRRYADVIIPWQRGDNIVAIDLITEHIRTKMQQHTLRRIYPNLEVIPSNYQVRAKPTVSSTFVVVIGFDV